MLLEMNTSQRERLATELAEDREARLRMCILQPVVSWAWCNINNHRTVTVAQARPTMLCTSLVIVILYHGMSELC